MNDVEHRFIYHQCSILVYFQVMCIHSVGVGLCIGVYNMVTVVNSLVLLLVKPLSKSLKGHTPTRCPSSHLLVVPLEHDELVLQGLVLTLQIHPGQVHVIQHPLQSSNVRLHSHPHGQLVLIPGGEETDRSGRFQ